MTEDLAPADAGELERRPPAPPLEALEAWPGPRRPGPPPAAVLELEVEPPDGGGILRA